MTQSRTPPPFASAILAVVIACALSGPAIADPLPSREYPATYSSRKAPWYDPFGMFTPNDKKPTISAQPTQIKTVSADVANDPPGTIATPAWKWYGYGTPTPGQNPLAPNGTYLGVPGNWYTSSGTTPGAMPHARIAAGLPTPNVIPDPIPTPRRSFGTEQTATVIPPNGPSLPTPAPGGSPADVSWQSVPARLRAPAGGSFATDDDRPRASLKAPVPVDEATVPVAVPTQPEQPVPPTRIRQPGEQSCL